MGVRGYFSRGVPALQHKRAPEKKKIKIQGRNPLGNTGETIRNYAGESTVFYLFGRYPFRAWFLDKHFVLRDFVAMWILYAANMISAVP